MFDKTKAEIEVLKSIKASQDAGDDPFGDDEFDSEGVTAASQDSAGNKKAEDVTDVEDLSAKDDGGNDDQGDDDQGDVADDDKGEDDKDADGDQDEAPKSAETTEIGETGDFDEESLRDIVDDEPAKPQRYQAEVPQDYKEKRTELIKSKSELMKKLMDGDIDADEYATEELRISTELEDLAAQRIRAETLLEANQQAQAQEQSKAIQAIIRRAKGTIEYLTDPKAQKQFDAAMSVVSAGDDGDLTYAQMAEKAHEMVLMARGIQQAAPANKGASTSTGDQPNEDGKGAKAAARKADGVPPVTLRGIPAASTPNANGDLMDQLGRLNGQSYEEAFAKLSPAQRARMLDED
jgi:hypothetical protein